jgi:hypothetical protein
MKVRHYRIRSISGRSVEVMSKKPTPQPPLAKAARKPRFRREKLLDYAYVMIPVAFLGLRRLSAVDKVVAAALSGQRFVKESETPEVTLEELEAATGGIGREELERSIKTLEEAGLIMREGGTYRLRSFAGFLERSCIEGPKLNYRVNMKEACDS